MKKICALALATALLPSLAMADLTPAAFRQMSAGNKTEKGMVEMYVGGVVKGYLNANAFLSATKQPLLFCYDGDIDTGTAKNLAAKFINEHLAKNPEDSKKEMVEFLLLVGLKSKYPC